MYKMCLTLGVIIKQHPPPSLKIMNYEKILALYMGKYWILISMVGIWSGGKAASTIIHNNQQMFHKNSQPGHRNFRIIYRT